MLWSLSATLDVTPALPTNTFSAISIDAASQEKPIWGHGLMMICQSMNCCWEKIDTMQSGSWSFQSASLLKQLIGRSDWTQQCRSSQPPRLVVCCATIESMPLSEQFLSLPLASSFVQNCSDHWSVLSDQRSAIQCTENPCYSRFRVKSTLQCNTLQWSALQCNTV